VRAKTHFYFTSAATESAAFAALLEHRRGSIVTMPIFRKENARILSPSSVKTERNIFHNAGSH
jgi:hypothetical protein